jgi:hypothetical protein
LAGDDSSLLVLDEMSRQLVQNLNWRNIAGQSTRELLIDMDNKQLQTLARDLRKTFPRSPRTTLGGFVIAARMLDKARADILGINGEYNFYPCGLGAFFWKFTGLDPQKFKEFVATGATDAEVDQWGRTNATVQDKAKIIKWNNEMIGLRICDLPASVQEYFEEYIPQFCKPPSKVKFFFDVYDVEEGVL